MRFRVSKRLNTFMNYDDITYRLEGALNEFDAELDRIGDSVDDLNFALLLCQNTNVLEMPESQAVIEDIDRFAHASKQMSKRLSKSITLLRHLNEQHRKAVALMFYGPPKLD